mgnify:CR=1 FL=1|jgi:hypothetical protein
MSGSLSGGNVIGSGSDTIILKLSEDAAAGQDAQFAVSVDGQQIGGRQTVTASHANGQDDTFTFLGNYGPGQHTVTVTFANNFLMPGEAGDRNLYVDDVSYNGQTVSSTTTPIYESPLFPPNSDHAILGNASFSVNDTTPVPADAPSTPSTTPGPVSIGDGPDTLVLNMAEDAYQGDAQFTVSVDGIQVGGTQTTTAHLAEGQQQEFDIHGNWGAGDHTVSVTFTNDHIGDFYPGTQLAIDTTDRNLYVMGARLNGGPESGGPWELDSNGTHSFTVSAGSDQSGGTSSASSTSNSSSGLSSGDTPAAAGSSSGKDAETSDTVTVTSETLSGGQSGESASGMSFIEPSSTDMTSASSGDGASETADSYSGTTDTAPTTIASSVGDSGQGTQDWTMPATSDWSGNTTTDSGCGSGGHWSNWSGDHQGWHAAWPAAQGQG